MSKLILSLALVLACAGIFTGCKKEKEKVEEKPLHTAGESFGGGIVFYVDGSGEHGLIASAEDQSAGIQWYNGSYLSSNAVSTALGSGQANTNAIISAFGSGEYAASVCDHLSMNGFDDWYLPSKDELNLLYQQKQSVGGFTNGFYWSSSDGGTCAPWHQDFANGYVNHSLNASALAHVRSIRAF